MITRELIDSAPIPGEDNSLRLFRRDLKNGPEFSIMLGGNELMNSRLSGSEEALATFACERLSRPDKARVLIGGLGMGFTLRAAQQCLNERAEIVVAELIPAVIQWAKGPMAALYGQCLSDPRVKLVTADVQKLISEKPNHYDAILLDVDNGPDGLTQGANDHIYDLPGLQAATAALRTDGLIAIWSATADASFTNRLSKAHLAVEEIPVRARGQRGARHTIWIARKK